MVAAAISTSRGQFPRLERQGRGLAEAEASDAQCYHLTGLSHIQLAQHHISLPPNLQDHLSITLIWYRGFQLFTMLFD